MLFYAIGMYVWIIEYLWLLYVVSEYTHCLLTLSDVDSMFNILKFDTYFDLIILHIIHTVILLIQIHMRITYYFCHCTYMHGCAIILFVMCIKNRHIIICLNESSLKNYSYIIYLSLSEWSFGNCYLRHGRMLT